MNIIRKFPLVSNQVEKTVFPKMKIQVEKTVPPSLTSWWFFIQKIGKTNINSYKLQIIWNFYSQRELKSVPNWSFRVIFNIKRLFETVPNWIFRRERQFKITPNLFPIGFFESFLKLNLCSKLFPIGFFHAYSPHDQIKREKKVFPIGYHNVSQKIT